MGELWIIDMGMYGNRMTYMGVEGLEKPHIQIQMDGCASANRSLGEVLPTAERRTSGKMFT